MARAGTSGLITVAAGTASPDTVAVQAGRAVTWRNADTISHRIVSDEAGLFDTGDISPGASAMVTIDAPGIHDWHDAGNPRLRGTVRVLP